MRFVIHTVGSRYEQNISDHVIPALTKAIFSPYHRSSFPILETMKRALFILILIFALLFLLAGGAFIYADYYLQPDIPVVPHRSIEENIVETIEGNRTFGSNWLRNDETGIWEMYLDGDAYDRGFAAGKLSEDLLSFQEEAFTSRLAEFVPNPLKQRLLIAFGKYYNHSITDHIPVEYQREVYGISRSADDAFLFMGGHYQRKLIYHAGHDVGHAFQNMGFVSGCSAVAARDSTDNSVIIARNFDFYVGDDFAKNKVVACVKPDSGYAFLSLSWPGMVGVVSAMNEKGLVVFLNAGPSQMPKGVKTPVTLIAREIVQYAADLKGALEIAEKRDVFVAENFVIASAEDDDAMIIEKSPGSTVVYNSSSKNLICTNHFQSEENRETEANLNARESTSTQYRYDRIRELLDSTQVHNPADLINLLHNRKGLNGETLGNGNEMSLNQLTGHHTIAFHPSEKKIYIAAVPNQNGPILVYNLDSIFQPGIENPHRLWSDTITRNQFIQSREYADYLLYRAETSTLQADINSGKTWETERLTAFESLNPDLYQTYALLGKYHLKNKDGAAAVKYLKSALDMPIPWKRKRDELRELLAKTEKPVSK